jgi:HEPN domain-containing protein
VKLYSPDEVEAGLLFDLAAKERRPEVHNIPSLLSRERKDFERLQNEGEYVSFVDSAFDHYLSARVLFSYHHYWYALFCAQQTVETYLKGFLRYRNASVPTSHKLMELLDRCREHADGSQFILGKPMEATARKFEPYNEIGRYPIARLGPPGALSCVMPETMWVLDYFVYRMRNEIPVPQRRADPFRCLMPFDLTGDRKQELEELLRWQNINFDPEFNATIDQPLREPPV